MKIRRVVTGHDANGRSVVASDDPVESVRPSLLPGFAVHLLWQASEPPRFPDAGERPELVDLFPPVGGFRFAVVTMPPTPNERPAAAPSGTRRQAAREMQRCLPRHAGLPRTRRHRHAHHSDDDLELVMRGELTLELDNGTSVNLHSGDTVVQNGTCTGGSTPEAMTSNRPAVDMETDCSGLDIDQRLVMSIALTRRPGTRELDVKSLDSSIAECRVDRSPLAPALRPTASCSVGEGSRQ